VCVCVCVHRNRGRRTTPQEAAIVPVETDLVIDALEGHRGHSFGISQSSQSSAATKAVPSLKTISQFNASRAKDKRQKILRVDEKKILVTHQTLNHLTVSGKENTAEEIPFVVLFFSV